jgi:hypothetical protein
MNVEHFSNSIHEGAEDKQRCEKNSRFWEGEVPAKP